MSISNTIRYLLISFLFLLFSLYFVSFTFATWSSDPSINTPVAVNSKRQDAFKVLSNGSGGGYILYVDQVDGGGIYLQRLDKNGERPWGSEGKMLGRLVGWVSAPLSMINDSEGGVIVVWEESRNNIVHIYAQRISLEGDLLWGDNGLLISLNTNLNAIQPHAVTDNEGGVVISWVYHSGSGTTQVRAQRVSEDGLLMWGTDGVVVAGFSTRDSVTKLASDGTGGAYVLYRGNNFQTLQISRVDNNGSLLWGQLGKTLSTTTTNPISGYQFVSDNFGNVYVIWSNFQDGQTVRAIQKLNNNGQILLADPYTIFPIVGEIVPVEEKVFVLHNTQVNPWDLDIYTSKLEISGNSFHQTDLMPILVKEGYQSINSYSEDDQGGLIVVWVDRNTDENHRTSQDDPNEQDDSDIYAQRIDANGIPLWQTDGILLTNAVSIQTGGLIDQVESLSFISTWTDIRNGSSSADIYAQKVNLDGTLGDSSLTPTPTPTPEPCVLTHFPEPISQKDNSWGQIPYGGKYETLNGQLKLIPFKDLERKTTNRKDSIAEWGCNLTSHAMNINYYAKIQSVKKADGTDFRTDPQVLNDWLQKNKGYSTGAILYDAQNNPYVASSLVDSNAVERYAKVNGVTLSYGPRVAYNSSSQTGMQFTQNNSATVNNAMCELRPGILKVQFPGASSPGHFVVGSGIATVSGTLSWRIHDPFNEPTPINLLSKYSNTFYQYQLAKTAAPSEYLTIALHSPVEFIVTAPDGKKTGYNPVTHISYSEIPESEYAPDTLSTTDDVGMQEQKLFSVHNPLPGEYGVQVIGTGNGTYDLEVTKSNGDNIEKLPIITGNALTNQTDIYELNNEENAEIIRKVAIDFPVFYGNKKSITTSNRTVNLTVFSSPTFPALTIDQGSISAGPGNAHVLSEKIADQNKDGLDDLVLSFNLHDMKITEETSEVCLTGKDELGTAIKGCDGLEFTSSSW